MSYNPENIRGKRPRAGEIWRRKDDISVRVEIIARRTISILFALGRRDNLSECEDKTSQVAYLGTSFGICSESYFVKRYVYIGRK